MPFRVGVVIENDGVPDFLMGENSFPGMLAGHAKAEGAKSHTILGEKSAVRIWKSLPSKCHTHLKYRCAECIMILSSLTSQALPWMSGYFIITNRLNCKLLAVVSVPAMNISNTEACRFSWQNSLFFTSFSCN